MPPPDKPEFFGYLYPDTPPEVAADADSYAGWRIERAKRDEELEMSRSQLLELFRDEWYTAVDLARDSVGDLDVADAELEAWRALMREEKPN